MYVTLKDVPRHQKDTAPEVEGVHIRKSIQTSCLGFALRPLLPEVVFQVEDLDAFSFSSCGRSSTLTACSSQGQTAARTEAPDKTPKQ